MSGEDRRGGRAFRRMPAQAMSSSAKFQVASPTGDGIATDSAFFVGWVDVLKEDDSQVSGFDEAMTAESYFKRRLVVCRPGLVEFHSSDPPTVIPIPLAANKGFVEASMDDEFRGSIRVTQDGIDVIHMKTFGGTIRAIADTVLGGKSNVCMLNAAENLMHDVNGQQMWTMTQNRNLYTFNTALKRSVELKGLCLDTEEDAVSTQLMHTLTCTTSNRERFVIRVPEPLLLLQWVGSLSQCDSALSSASLSGSTSVVAKLVRQESVRASIESNSSTQSRRTMQRSHTLGVGASLGIKGPMPMGEEEERLSRDEIKLQLASVWSPSNSVPTMKEILSDPPLRKVAYLWSVSQFCAENIKFFLACENCKAMVEEEDLATGLKKIFAEFISSGGSNAVNISGARRKKIRLQLEEATNVSEMADLVRDKKILDEPLAEIVRVMQYDLYPSLSLLFTEVFREKEQESSPPPLPQEKAPSGGSTLILARDCMKKGTLEQVLLFAHAGQEQNLILFLQMVSDFQLGKCEGEQIAATFCNPASSHFIMLEIAETNGIRWKEGVSREFFDEIVTEACAVLDSGLMRRYNAANAGKKPGKLLGGLWKTIGRK